MNDLAPLKAQVLMSFVRSRSRSERTTMNKHMINLIAWGLWAITLVSLIVFAGWALGVK